MGRISRCSIHLHLRAASHVLMMVHKQCSHNHVAAVLRVPVVGTVLPSGNVHKVRSERGGSKDRGCG